MKQSIEQARKIVLDVSHGADIRNGHGFRQYSTKKNGGTKRRPLTFIDRLAQKVSDSENKVH